MSGLIHRIVRAGRRAREMFHSWRQGGYTCMACGFVGRPLERAGLWPELVAEWELSADWHRWIDARESHRCARCGATLRSGQLAAALLSEMNRLAGSAAPHLKAACRDARVQRLRIAEINSAGNLHKHLKHCPGLRYSEYGSRDPAVPSEDLTQLSYADASFDLATTSDVMEHVPDPDRAWREVHRILKPGGAYVFSIPVVWDRPTRQRAQMRDGTVVHLLPPSHHGAAGEGRHDMLVFNEFGGDVVDRCRAAGFEVELLRDAVNPALVTFIARRAT